MHDDARWRAEGYIQTDNDLKAGKSCPIWTESMQDSLLQVQDQCSQLGAQKVSAGQC